MSRIYVGVVFLWAIQLDEMLIKDPAFELIAENLLLLLRISTEAMDRISFLQRLLRSQSVASFVLVLV